MFTTAGDRAGRKRPMGPGVFTSGFIQPPGARLTLTTGSPVMTANATAQTTVYCDSYVHGFVPIFNGKTWLYLPIPGDEISMGLDAGVPHVASGSLYDVFGVNNGGLVIAIGPAWSSTSSRGTGAGTTQISRQNGIWVNTVSLTHAWGGASGTTDYGPVAAKTATYLGTFYATANGQTGMNFAPAAASGGANPILGLYNGYNRVRTSGINRDNNNWTYASTTWRPSDNNTNNRVSFVDGLQQSSVLANVGVLAFTSNVADNASIGVNFDSTSATPPIVAVTTFTAASASMNVNSYSQPLLGFHFAQGMEQATVGGTATFDGNANSNQFFQLSIDLMM